MNASTAAPSGQLGQAPAAGTPDQPVGAGERIVTLDFVRGIAVLGILFPNIVAYGNVTLAYNWPKALPGGPEPFDLAVWLFQLVLIDGKFRGLFTLLFGAGMMLFMERAWARGATRWLQARRLFWLALFGLAHFYLLWTGDILFMYAIAGFGALAMVKWSARTQLRVGLAWYLVGALLLTVLIGGQAAIESLPQVQANAPEQYEELQEGVARMVSDSEAEGAVMAGGSYAEIVAYRVVEDSGGHAEAVFFALVETIPLMLIGMGLYRMGLFERRLDRSRMRRWGWTGFLGGAALTIPIGVLTISADFPLFLTNFAFNGGTAFLHLPMVLGLAALLSLWAPSASQGWLGQRFVAAGRMAFSNYIGCSAVMMLVFQGWAGGLYGQLHRLELLGIVLAAWALMLAWSKPWLARFRYGPLEWLWRCLTYGRLFALRR
jgi:uncharacterized protein